MLHIISLLCLLLSLYNSGSPVATDPRFLQEVCLEVQLHGTQVATERLQSDLPAIISQAGIKVPAQELGKLTAQEPDELTTQEPDEVPAQVSDVLPAQNPDEVPAPPEIEIASLDYGEELKKLGFYKDETSDSKLNLRNAILRFQSSYNQTATGNWDDKCLSSLAMQLLTGSAACEDIVVAPPTESKWITINKTKRILTFYENKNVLQKYPIAIGNPPSLTPNGKFAIVSKVINPAWGGGGFAKPVKGGVPQNPLGYRWMGLSYKNGSTLGIHGNNSPYSIGKNISHGCIRMINSDVEQLFTVVPKSAPVWIGTEEKLREWGVEQPEYNLFPDGETLLNNSPEPDDEEDPQENSMTHKSLED